ncbi:MAG: CRISPR-associated protein Cas4, partial [Acidimicrobiales bacterium]
MTDAGQVVPELVPARMVNEFAYCPRLFFLEWVQARFAHNDDTAEGVYVHRAVDLPAGGAPLPSDEGEFRRARSLDLSSERLGLVAKVDVVEGAGEGEEVVPVDVKKGSPPDIPEGAWEPERVQVCIQGLLLREAGYACQKGYLYFAEARRRVEVLFTDALIERTLAIVEELR